MTETVRENANELREPLLPPDESNVVETAEEGRRPTSTSIATTNEHRNSTDDSESTDCSFDTRQELVEMAQLAFPLAVSFFCRMGMASTDSSFVGHIHDARHSAQTYLAAAVLSDMVVNVCLTPPLAFNQVLNALVGQAMGSGNPKMAGIWLQQSMFWLTVSMLPCLTGLWYVEPILLWLDFPADVAAVAGTYAKYNLLWPIPNGLYQCMRFYFQAAGLPRPAMYNNILFFFVNALLNWILVFGGPLPWRGLGFVGAAVSLSISRTLQGLVYGWYMFAFQQLHRATWPTTSVWQHHTAARTTEFLKQSVPNIGTLLFQSLASQATTVLVGRLGTTSIAASSALSTVTIPYSGTLSATFTVVSSVRVGFHLGRNQSEHARRAAWLVLQLVTAASVVMAVFFGLWRHSIMRVATNDAAVVEMASTLVVAMLVGTWLNLVVSIITAGVFGGMGRPLLATVMSLGIELPLTVGGVAVYVLWCHGNLLGVYWWQAIAGGIEAVIVLAILMLSNWERCAAETQHRQEAPPQEPHNDDGELLLQGEEEGEGSTTFDASRRPDAPCE